MASQTVLLTGVTGFIGDRLARLLAGQGAEVHAIVRPGSTVPADLPATVHRYDGSAEGLSWIVGEVRPHTVFHLASLYIAQHDAGQIAPLVNSNVAFPTQLLDAMAQHGIRRLVNTGTNWQHYRGIPYDPVNLYAATKQAFEAILAFYCAAHGLTAVTLKLFDTYGVGDRRRKLIQLLVDIAASGEALGMSPGKQIIDLTHVDDVCRAFAAAERWLDGAAEGSHTAFLVSGERHSVRDLAALVARVTGRLVDARFGERPYRPREVMEPAVPTPSDRLPGWTPRRSLEAELPALMR